MNDQPSLRLDSRLHMDGPRRTLSSDLCTTPGYAFTDKILEPVLRGDGSIHRLDLHLVGDDALRQKAASLFPDAPAPNEDAYVFSVGSDSVVAWSATLAGLFYAVNALKRHAVGGTLAEGCVYNSPDLPFRGIKIYLPGREDIPFFYETVDLCGYLGYNKVVIEIGGAMEYKRHPEINESWVRYCDLFRDDPDKTHAVQNGQPFHKNSIHSENGGGGFLTQDEVRTLVAYCRERGLDVIPEVPCLTHCDYLLLSHRELAERPEDPYPDTYCPSDPATYALLFDVLDEILTVFKPKTVHIGHDEYYSLRLCPRCRDRRGEDIYAGDIHKIYMYLKDRGVGTMMWGEKLLALYAKDGEAGGGLERFPGRGGLYIPETYKARDLIPKGIQIMHWYWGVNRDCELQLFERGFPVVFGNFNAAALDDWKTRRERGVQGVCISNWSRLNLAHMQRNTVLFNLALSAMLLWNPDYDALRYRENVLFCSDLLFLYKNLPALSAPHIVLTHAVKLRYNHRSFVDGNFIDYKSDYLGTYTVRYPDGSEDTTEIYYGLNIGDNAAHWQRRPSKDNWSVGLGGDSHLLEPTYTCRLVQSDRGAFYSLVLPLRGRPVSLRFTPKTSAEDFVFLSHTPHLLPDGSLELEAVPTPPSCSRCDESV